MAAVEVAVGTVGRQIEPGVATDTVDQLWRPALMDRSVADQPQIDLQLLSVLPQVLFEVGRSGLFFALEEKNQVGAGCDLLMRERIESGGDGHHGRLVVARRPGIDSPLGIDRLSRLGQRSDGSTLFDRCCVHGRVPGWVEPLVGVNGLAVVVDIDSNRPPSADIEGSVNDWGRALELPDLRLHARSLEKELEVVGIAPDILSVCSHIRVAQQLGESLEDLGSTCHSIRANILQDAVLIDGCQRCRQSENGQPKESRA